MLIDDDRHEAVFWRHVIDTSYRHQIALKCFQTVDSALEALADFQPDAVILDNKVPPHETACFGLSELKKRCFEGDIYVWSYTDRHTLKRYLSDWPNIALLSKNDYMGFKVRDLIETHLI